jgi:DNA-3-methyladenine glycosylase
MVNPNRHDRSRECTILSRSFYERSALEVARDLLGKYLVRASREGTTYGMIVEAEAYTGEKDRASHSYGGRRTPRNEVMYGEGGHAYIYLIYGMYHCMNVVTGRIDEPQGVFIRALEPLGGLGIMARRRGFDRLDERKTRELTSGPSKLCQAMGIDRSLNGLDLTGDTLYLTRGKAGPFIIRSTPRINIEYAGEDRSLPYRFLIAGNRFVSR